MNKSTDSYYKILGVSPNATFKEIREAYLALCKDFHPDRLPSEFNQNLKKLAEERLKLINEAYETLKDEQSRTEYDRQYGTLKNEEFRDSIVEDENDKHNLDYLLSESLLSEGLLQLQNEEKLIWLEHIKELDNIDFFYTNYLRNISGHTPRYFYPDTLLLRLDRLLRIIYSGIPTAAIMSGFLTIPLWIGLTIFSFFGILKFLPFLDTEESIYHFALVIFILLLLMFLHQLITDNDNKISEKGVIFTNECNSYWSSSQDLGSYYRLYKLKKPIYKAGYVKSVHHVKKKMDNAIALLVKDRHKKFESFLKIERYLLTPQYVALLSLSDRFLLTKALEQKAQEERGDESTKNALKFAGAVGLVALLIATGGGGF